MESGPENTWSAQTRKKRKDSWFSTHQSVAGVFSGFCDPYPLCDIPSGCYSLMGPWTVTRSSLRMLRRVAAFCRPQRPVLLLVSFPRSRSPVVGVLGLCWMWRDVPFARQWRPIIGVLGVVLVVAGVVWLCLLPTHLCPQAVRSLPRCGSVCVRPTCPVPPRSLPPLM